MDYLVYVEHSAENLQFYLWYQDYVRRWNTLPASRRALSPEMPADQTDFQNSKRGQRASREVKTSLAKPKIRSEGWSASGKSFLLDDQDENDAASFESGVTSDDGDISSQSYLKWQPCMSFGTLFIHRNSH